MANVMGSRMESVAITPMPGSTPTRLPITTPNRQNTRLCGSSATPNPNSRLCRAPSSIGPSEGWEWHLQQVGEQSDTDGGDDGGERCGAAQGRLPVAQRGDEDAGEGGGRQ